jgi:hypothetical protein
MAYRLAKRAEADLEDIAYLSCVWLTAAGTSKRYSDLERGRGGNAPGAVAGTRDAADLTARGERYMDADELAAALGKKPSGGHWNTGIAVLRNNGLIETKPSPAQAGGRRHRTAALFRE